MIIIWVYAIKLSVGMQTNATARSDPAADARGPGTGDFGGLGLSGTDQVVSGMPDISQLNQLLQNPAISQMMESLLSNPQYINQVLLIAKILIFSEI